MQASTKPKLASSAPRLWNALKNDSNDSKEGATNTIQQGGNTISVIVRNVNRGTLMIPPYDNGIDETCFVTSKVTMTYIKSDEQK